MRTKATRTGGKTTTQEGPTHNRPRTCLPPTHEAAPRVEVVTAMMEMAVVEMVMMEAAALPPHYRLPHTT